MTRPLWVKSAAGVKVIANKKVKIKYCIFSLSQKASVGSLRLPNQKAKAVSLPYFSRNKLFGLNAPEVDEISNLIA